MTQGRKYATLPDLVRRLLVNNDSAPDIYETPDVLPPKDTSSPSSPANDTSSDDDTSHPSRISRHQLNPDAARTTFSGSRVDARNVDFSDRVDGRRRSYRTTSRARRRGNAVLVEDSYGEAGDEEDDDEGLERKIARLRREVEELKVEVGKKREDENQDQGKWEREESGPGGILEMARVLQEVQKLRDEEMQNSSAAKIKQNGGRDSRTLQSQAVSSNEDDLHAKQSQLPPIEGIADKGQFVTRAASFDARLAVLEKALGSTSTALSQHHHDTSTKGVLPSLRILETQISTLTSATPTSLETLGKQIRQLTQDAERLEESRTAARTAQDVLKSRSVQTRPSSAPKTSSMDAELEDPEHTAKVEALYKTLPTIETLSPLLPAVLDRLRSLRLIHADAASAAERLTEVEKRQAGMAEDIRKWREGLERVKTAMDEGVGVGKGNAAAVEEWVKDLEKRLKELQ